MGVFSKVRLKVANSMAQACWNYLTVLTLKEFSSKGNLMDMVKKYGLIKMEKSTKVIG